MGRSGRGYREDKWSWKNIIKNKNYLKKQCQNVISEFFLINLYLPHVFVYTLESRLGNIFQSIENTWCT